MSTKATTGYLTMVESVQRLGPDQMPARMFAEVLNEMNEITVDAAMEEANDIWSHMEHVRTRLPTVSGRSLNFGATRSTSSVKRYREQMMLLEVWCEIDAKIAEAQPSLEAYLQGEFGIYAEAAMQEACRIVVYGNPGSDSREVKGWFERYKALSDVNVVGLSGTGSDCTSLAMVEWGPQVNKLIYPRGHPSFGMMFDDKGKGRITDSSNNPYDAYSMKGTFEFGLSIPDETRAIQRLANIDTDAFGSRDLVATNAFRELHAARNRLQHAGKNAVIYGNRDVKTQYDIYADEKSNGFYSRADLATGQPITSWYGIPVRMLEAILSTETAIT